MTFWWSQDNYGQILQCFALQKYLSEYGHEVFVIKYNFEQDRLPPSLIKRVVKLFNPLFVVNHIIQRIKEKKVSVEYKKHDRKFDEFRKKLSKSHKGQIAWNRTKIFCIENNVVYSSMKEASEKLNLTPAGISKVCRGIMQQTGGYHFKYYNLLCKGDVK